MDRPENVIQTPNQKVELPKKETPHLTEKELETIRQVQRFRNKINQHEGWCLFQRMSTKPKKISKPLTFNEKGEVVVCEGREAPIGQANLRKGTLRNKKCSCGSGKKYKRCCLNKKTN